MNSLVMTVSHGVHVLQFSTTITSTSSMMATNEAYVDYDENVISPNYKYDSY